MIILTSISDKAILIDLLGKTNSVLFVFKEKPYNKGLIHLDINNIMSEQS